MTPEEILAQRKRHFGRGLSLSYRSPLTIVRGEGQYLYDDGGRRYLDCVNNVCHVGHCHPKVVRAAADQMAQLNTNTRYLHPNLSRYVEELTNRFPDPLSVCYLVCSGSEALDLALRLARCHSNAQDLLVLEAGYHGHTQAVIDVSEYKFGGPGGAGAPATTHVQPMPCGFSGKYRYEDGDIGARYAAEVEAALTGLRDAGTPIAGFLCESILGVGGQIVLPEGYLRRVYAAVRDAGGVCIADEVQVGFGRPGKTFWGFELQETVPDIVTLGKPIGNGHPMAAVITTPEIAESFDNGMEYFNTYGGNPVSCAVGLAVLDVIDRENLQRHALEVGELLLDRLRSLKDRHELIGDVRGVGLFAGIELVRDRQPLAPASKECYDTVEAMKNRGFLLSVDGPRHNVIKIKPPMVFSATDAEALAHSLDEVLGEG